MATFICTRGYFSQLLLDLPGAFALIDPAGGEWICREHSGTVSEAYDALADEMQAVVAERAVGLQRGGSTMRVENAADRDDLRRRLAVDLLAKHPLPEF